MVKSSPAHEEGGINVEPTDLVIGAQLCCWETASNEAYPNLVERLPTMSERVWRLEQQGTYDEYRARYEALTNLTETICR